MADQADGSIIVDTEVNADGFKAGSAELLAAIKSLSNEVKTLGQILKETFGGSDKSVGSTDGKVQALEATIASLQAQVKSLQDTVAALQEKLNSLNSGQTTQTPLDGVTDAAQGANEQVTALEAKIKELEGVIAGMQKQLDAAASAPSEVDFDTEAAEAKIAALENKIGELESTIADMQSGEGETATQTVDFGGTPQKASSLQKQIDAVNSSVDRLGPTFQRAMGGSESAMTSFETKAGSLNTKIEELEQRLAAAAQAKVPTDDYQWLTREIDKAQNALVRLLDKQDKMKAVGVKSNSKQWQSLQYDIQKVREQLGGYKYDLQELEAEGATHISGMDTAQYAQMETALVAARARLDEMQGSVSGVRAKMGGLISMMKNAPTLTGHLKNAMTGVAGAASRVWGAMKSIGSGIKNTVLHPIHSLNQGIGSVISGFGHIAKKGVSAFGKVVKGIKTAISKLREFKKSTNGGHSAIAKFGKKITGFGSMLKRMALRKLMMGILTAVKDGFNNLAQYSTQTNKDLSALKSSLTQLKNSFAAAFAPILTVVTPILTKLINYLSTALTYIGKLFAALSGAKTFTKATAVQEDYAASLGATGSAAEKAKKQLAGFDELNVLSDSSSDGGGGGGGGASPSEMFEEVPIESSITDFIGKLKEAFRNGDYAGIGVIIGEGINTAVQAVNDFISWDNVGSKITAGVKGVAQCFNALVDTVNWELIGDTFAQGFNTAINTLFLILTEFDWPGLAAGLANNLNGVVSGFDWAKLGTTLSTGMRTAIATLRSAITTFDWAALGKGVADGINSIDWVGILSDLAAGISDVLKGALDLLIGFAENLDWAKLGSDLWNSLIGIITNIDWGGIIAKAFQLLGAALAGAVSLIVGFAKSLWESLKSAFESTKNYFASYIDEAGGNVIQGLLNGIWNGIKNIGTWIKDKIFTPFINGFKNAFGIHSPSTVMAEMGGYLIEGLLQGIKNLWSTITDFFSNALASLKQTIANAWSAIQQGAQAAWQGISNTVSSAWSGIKSGVSSACTAVGGAISNAWSGIKSGASAAWSAVSSTVSNAWNSIKSGVSNACTAVKTTASNAWNSIKSTVSSKLSSIKSTATSTFTSLKNSATTWGKDVCDNMANGISKAKSTVESAVKGVADKIKSFLGFSEPEDGPLSNFHTYMPDMIDLMTYGIKKNQGKAIGAVASMASAISSEIQNGDYTMGVTADDQGTANALGRFSDTITNSFTSLLDRLQNIANSVTFTVPAVATGGVLPYSVSASSSTRSRKSENSMALSTIKRAVQEAMGEGGGTVGTIVVKLECDGKTLAEVVQKYDHRNRRTNGGI